MPRFPMLLLPIALSVGGIQSHAAGQPSVHVMYYSYFEADFESRDFSQWNGYRSWDGRLHNPTNLLGPESWRYDLALGSGYPSSGMHYPFLGRYDNSNNLTVVIWQFQCMKNAGIDAVCASNLGHGDDTEFMERMLSAARQVGIQVYLMDETGSGDLGGAGSQEDLDEAVDELIEKCNATLIAHATDEAYFKIDGRPVYFLPFWIAGFGVPGTLNQVTVMQEALNRFKTGVTIDGREPWLYTANVYLANFSGSLSYDVNTPPGPTVHLSQAWANTGFESFTCWDPLGIMEQYNRDDITQAVRDDNLMEAFSTYITNQKAFGLTPIVPIQAAFDRRNNEGPGSGGLTAVDPKYVTPHDPAFWRTQIQLAIASGATQIWIAQWNEWHEDQTLEPGWGFTNETGNEDPFAFLRILADELGQEFTTPPLPPETSVDPTIWDKVSAYEDPMPDPTPTPTEAPSGIRDWFRF